MFLSQYGFDGESFVLASTIYMCAFVLSGYIILSDTVEQQENQEKRLHHLVKEVLHEINIPISTIDANLSMISKTLDPKQQKRATRISSSLLRLKRLYSELSYSIKKEILPIDKEHTRVDTLMKERVSVAMEFGRHSFDVNMNELSIEADRIGLEQVIDNILENAMKYSAQDSIIEISLKDNKLSIIDQGVGMDANQILHVYEKYYQAHSHSRGEGIGLALVKRYCDESGIGIKIISKVDIGTEILLDFGNLTLN